MTQTDLTNQNEKERESHLINRQKVMELVKNHFAFANSQLQFRSPADQQKIGDLLTVLEIELKKDLKSLEIS